jgi:uncharacterized protein YkwD
MKRPLHRLSTAAPLLLVALCALGAAADDGCRGLDREAAMQAINTLRERGGVCAADAQPTGGAPLRWNERLERAAAAQAAWLASQDTLLHLGPQGQVLAERAREAGYRFARVTENLGLAQTSLAQVLRSWSASPAHCRNLYDARVTETALACVPSASGRPVWVMLHARPL